jgi:hypothetical protein
LAWSDHGVPENVKNTLSFVEHVNKLYRQENCSTSAITVHCSAGIGRTGAVIVIDMLIDKIRHYGIQCDIDVQKTVLHVRSQRSGLVQTEKQYQFLYTALKEYIDFLKNHQQKQKQQNHSVNNAFSQQDQHTSSINSFSLNRSKQQKPIYLVNTTTNSKENMNHDVNQPSATIRKSARMSPTVQTRLSNNKIKERDSSDVESHSRDKNDFNICLTTSSIIQDDGYLMPSECNDTNQRKPVIKESQKSSLNQFNSALNSKNFNFTQK